MPDVAEIAKSLTEARRTPKSELGLIAMAAWCNVSVDQLPEEARTNPNDYTVQAWARVFEAVRAYLENSHD